LNFRAFVTVALVVSFYVLVVNVPSQVDALESNVAICSTLLPPRSAGLVQVYFDSVSLFQFYPQACSFNVNAKSLSPGSSITKISWQFGDGSSLDVPYCCQSQVSEVQYHSYAQPGTYTVSVAVYDNLGNVGSARVAVNW
jgi:hypothetical protein